jgi:membrane protease YdiL (CAAX protease family)
MERIDGWSHGWAPQLDLAFSTFPPAKVFRCVSLRPTQYVSNVLRRFTRVILYTWVYNNTDRSILAVILFHFAGNFWGEFLGISVEVQMYRMILMIIVVAFIAWWSGPATLRRDLEPARV